jgi:predicted DNA-binding protein (UPF0251 family)
VQSCPTCSGGAKVGFVGQGGTLTFNSVTVPSAGTYDVTIAYCDGSEKKILLLRFFGNMTQSQIAAELGISHRHVSRLLARTLTQLRDGLTIDDEPGGRRELSLGLLEGVVSPAGAGRLSARQLGGASSPASPASASSKAGTPQSNR